MASTRLRSLLLIGLAVAGVATACYKDPNKELDQAQQTMDLQATLEDLGNRTTELQFALDSIKGIVARQDTTIARLANLAGVPYTP